MNINAFSRSKSRNNKKPGDDAMLIIPGNIIALLDGATDPFASSKEGGESSGRYASNTVAAICAELFSDKAFRESSAEFILRSISERFAECMSNHKFVHSPSTTLSMVIFLEDSLRILNVGDSGIRVNGTDVYCHHKPIDSVATTTRIAIHHRLKDVFPDPDTLEKATRRLSFHGIECGVSDEIIAKKDVDTILARVLEQHSKIASHEDLERFVLKGIVSQKVYANNGEHPLGFSTLDGNLPLMNDVIDTTLSLESVRTLELFSDGYLTMPAGTKVSDWEEEYARVEQLDFAKVSDFENIKGSTSEEFFDDRSIISLEMTTP